MSRLSPLGAVGCGILAGFTGCLAQDLFFALSRRLAPKSPTQVFDPPEEAQLEEGSTETVARRVVEDLAQRGPVEYRQLGGRLVHYAFGCSWGALYGVVAASLPKARGPKAGLAFGLGVWALSDSVLLPAFRLAAWPQHYAVKTHLYALAAHAAYGMAVESSFSTLDRRATAIRSLTLAALGTRNVPRLLRPTARRVTNRALRLVDPARRVAAAL